MNSQEYRALVNRLEAIQEAGTPQADATPEPQPAPGPQDPGSADHTNQMDQSSDAVANGSAPGSDTPAVYDASPGQIPSAEEMKNMDIGFGPGKFLRGKNGLASANEAVSVLEEKSEITL